MVEKYIKMIGNEIRKQIEQILISLPNLDGIKIFYQKDKIYYLIVKNNKNIAEIYGVSKKDKNGIIMNELKTKLHD